MEIILHIHSYWAYLTLGILVMAVSNFLVSFFQKRDYFSKDLRMALFTLIVAHIQLLIGLSWYFMSPAYKHMKKIGMSAAMKDSDLRNLAVEHPLMMIIAVTLITIGFSKHKKRATAGSIFKTLSIYYGIALMIFIAMIPWNLWLS